MPFLEMRKKKAIGGHLIRGKLNVRAEIVLLKPSLKAKRKIEPKTGLKGLFLE